MVLPVAAKKLIELATEELDKLPNLVTIQPTGLSGGFRVLDARVGSGEAWCVVHVVAHAHMTLRKVSPVCGVAARHCGIARHRVFVSCG